MRKSVKIIILSVIFSSLLAVNNSHAMFVKTDFLKSAGSAFVAVTDIFRKVKKSVEESAVVKTVKNMGEGYKSFKKDFDKVRDKYEAEKKGLSDIKTMVTGEIASGQALYEQEKAKLEAKTQGLKEIEDLQEQKALIEATFNSDVAQLRAEAAAEQNNLDNNSKIYTTLMSEELPDEGQKQEYQDIIAANNKRKLEIQTELAGNIANATNAKDEQVKAIEDKIKSYKGELVEIGYNAGKEVADVIFKMKKAKAAQANEETANELFLTKDQTASVKNVDVLTLRRNKAAFDNTTEAFSESLETKRKIFGYRDMAQSTQDSVALLDGSTDSISQDTMAKVEQMKLMIDFIRLKVFALKAETSAEIAKMSIYRRMDYDSDQGTLDLCNYRPSEEQKAQALKRAKEYFGVKQDENI